MSKIKDVTKFDWKVAGSVVVGMALFGVVVYGARKAATTLRNSGQSTIGNTVDRAADIATAV